MWVVPWILDEAAAEPVSTGLEYGTRDSSLAFDASLQTLICNECGECHTDVAGDFRAFGTPGKTKTMLSNSDTVVTAIIDGLTQGMVFDTAYHLACVAASDVHKFSCPTCHPEESTVARRNFMKIVDQCKILDQCQLPVWRCLPSGSSEPSEPSLTTSMPFVDVD